MEATERSQGTKAGVGKKKKKKKREERGDAINLQIGKYVTLEALRNLLGHIQRKEK